MKVIYTKSIVEKIEDAIQEASRKKRTIGIIELTFDEFQEFRFLANSDSAVQRKSVVWGDMGKAMFCGVRIELEDTEGDY